MSNEVDRGWRGLTALDCDTRESHEIKKTLKNRQYVAVRNAQQYLGAAVVKKIGDDVQMRYRDRTFLIDVKGDRRFPD